MKKILFSVAASFLLFYGNSVAQDWTAVNSTGTTFILYGMSFPPGQSTVGYACGMQYTYNAPGVIVKTVDGGNNWTQIWPVSGSISGLQGIWFISEQVGFACGWNNYFIKTTDGGVTWNPITVGSNVWYYTDVVFWDANNGVATGNMNNPGDQAVFITSNGGNTWVPATSGVGTNEIMGLAYADQNTVYAVGTGAHVFKSTDGGHNWTTTNTLGALLFGVDFANSTFGVVGGEEWMYATNDGGLTFPGYNTGYENFYATKAFPDGTGYIGGTDERIWKTTNYGTTWTLDNSGTGTSSLYRIRFTPNGNGFACGSQGRILKISQPLEADFEASSTTVCTGNSVTFYDNSTGDVETWAWTFEGGTPSTSSVPNPVVVYNTPGIYDVQLTISSNGNYSTEMKTDYITVYGSLTQPAMPSGPADVCGTYTYTYTTTTVQYADEYDWSVTPASAGTISGTGTSATLSVANNWSGDFTIKVRATNDCGDGPWSPDFNCTSHYNPVQYSLLGDGAYCEGDPGFEIVQDDSETGVDYELFKDNVTTGIVIPGTGSQISFGVFNTVGLYTATGNAGYCEENMVGQVYVHMSPLPGQSAMPEGEQTVCEGESQDYSTTGSTGATGYAWSLSPSDAGVLTPDGMECTIEWAMGFSGKAYLSVTGFNTCGEGAPSDELEVTIFTLPTPEVSGQSTVCNDDEGEYSTEEISGSTYTWDVSGGTIISGNGTYMINVQWGAPGSGTVTVTELTSAGCEATSETFAVTIDDCTGIGEGQFESVMVYPNPASDNLYISGLNNASARFYNLLGQEVIRLDKLNGQQTIDISWIQKGIYLLRIDMGGESTTLRVVKE